MELDKLLMKILSENCQIYWLKNWRLWGRCLWNRTARSTTQGSHYESLTLAPSEAPKFVNSFFTFHFEKALQWKFEFLAYKKSVIKSLSADGKDLVFEKLWEFCILSHLHLKFFWKEGHFLKFIMNFIILIASISCSVELYFVTSLIGVWWSKK